MQMRKAYRSQDPDAYNFIALSCATVAPGKPCLLIFPLVHKIEIKVPPKLGGTYGYSVLFCNSMLFIELGIQFLLGHLCSCNSFSNHFLILCICKCCISRRVVNVPVHTNE